MNAAKYAERIRIVIRRKVLNHIYNFFSSFLDWRNFLIIDVEHSKQTTQSHFGLVVSFF